MSRKRLRVHFDCQTCGACCGPTYWDETHVDLEEEDVARLSPHYRRLYVIQEGSHAALATKDTGHNGCACVALRGKIGKRVFCAIYDRRPTACRAFQPGSESCIQSRRALDLPV